MFNAGLQRALTALGERDRASLKTLMAQIETVQRHNETLQKENIELREEFTELREAQRAKQLGNASTRVSDRRLAALQQQFEKDKRALQNKIDNCLQRKETLERLLEQQGLEKTIADAENENLKDVLKKYESAMSDMVSYLTTNIIEPFVQIVSSHDVE